MSEPLQHPAVPGLKEYFYDGRPMITETDLSGRITFVNRKFTEMSAYPKQELLGRPHSIVRHPDMPAACFRLMWETIRTGRSWQGYVKNLRKDGNYYWVVVHIEPKKVSGDIVGFIAVRRQPNPAALETVKNIYAEARLLEDTGDLYGAEGLVGQTARINADRFPQEMLLA
jgi:PAS domain S-box-containing protein